MNFSLELTQEAKSDIFEAYSYYEFVLNGLGSDFQSCVKKSIKNIQNNPFLFQIKYNRVRIKHISKFPFGIHFIIVEDNIIVIGILHTSQSPFNWEKRIL